VWRSRWYERRKYSEWLHEDLELRAQLTHGVLQADVREEFPVLASHRSQNLADVLRGLFALARRLVAPRDIPARIAENLRCEPEAGVRIRLLLSLIQEFPEHRHPRCAPRHEEDPDAACACGPRSRSGRGPALAAGGSAGEGAPTRRLHGQSPPSPTGSVVARRRTSSTTPCGRAWRQRRDSAWTCLAESMAPRRSPLSQRYWPTKRPRWATRPRWRLARRGPSQRKLRSSKRSSETWPQRALPRPRRWPGWRRHGRAEARKRRSAMPGTAT
jgi:hypothetical protein